MLFSAKTQKEIDKLYKNRKHIELTVGILKDGVKAIINDETVTIPCDSVVFAAGYRANHTLYERVLDAGYECAQIGDNVKPGKIIDAISQGYNYIRVLE